MSKPSYVPATIVLTVLGMVVIVLALGYAIVVTGAIPANADAKPGGFERWAAHTSLDATIARETVGLHDPYPSNDAAIADGIRLYGLHCAVCHGTANGDATTVARGLYQSPPQFAKHGVSDDPVETSYWKIAHGIRLTGMPAFDRTLREQQLWAIATFLKRMDSLSPTQERQWHALKIGSAVAPTPAT